MNEVDQNLIWNKFRKLQVFLGISTILVIEWILLYIGEYWGTGDNKSLYFYVFGITVLIWNFPRLYTPSEKLKKKLNVCKQFMLLIILLSFLVVISNIIQVSIDSHFLSWIIGLFACVLISPHLLFGTIFQNPQTTFQPWKKFLLIYSMLTSIFLSIFSIFIIISGINNGGFSFDFEILILFHGLMGSYIFILIGMTINYRKNEINNKE